MQYLAIIVFKICCRLTRPRSGFWAEKSMESVEFRSLTIEFRKKLTASRSLVGKSARSWKSGSGFLTLSETDTFHCSRDYVWFYFRMALSIVQGYIIDTTKPWCSQYARSEPNFATQVRKKQQLR